MYYSESILNNEALNMKDVIRFLHNEYPELNDYGLPNMSEAERAQMSITGTDEYMLIIRPLLMLHVFFNQNDADLITNELLTGLPDADDFSYPALQNIKFIRPNVEYLLKVIMNTKRELNLHLGRDLTNEEMHRYICKAFIMHDRIKTKAFRQSLGLGTENQESADHDEHLALYWASHSKEQAIFHCVHPITNILDVLGHSPDKIQSFGPMPSLALFLDTMVFLKQYKENIISKGNPVDSETRRAFLDLFKQRARAIGLQDQAEILNEIDTEQTFFTSTAEQQNLMAFIALAGGARIEQKTNAVDYCRELWMSWVDSKNKAIVEEFIQNKLADWEGTSDSVVGFNSTGALNKCVHPLKGFHEPVEKGGMGGSPEEMISVFLCFYNRKISEAKNTGNGVENHISHNENQFVQLLELSKGFFLQFNNITPKAVYKYIDFGSISNNSELETCLKTHREEKTVPVTLYESSEVGLFKRLKTADVDSIISDSAHRP